MSGNSLIHSFSPFHYSDIEIARAVSLESEPSTIEGKLLVGSLMKTAEENGSAIGPCSFPAYYGIISGRKIRVFVEEPEENARLLGPACMNEIFVHKGAVLGVPDTEKFAHVRKEGVFTGISYYSGRDVACGSRDRSCCKTRNGSVTQVKMARLPGDINLRIEPWAMRFITDNNLKTDVRGPVFLTIRSE